MGMEEVELVDYSKNTHGKYRAQRDRKIGHIMIGYIRYSGKIPIIVFSQKYVIVICTVYIKNVVEKIIAILPDTGQFVF
jgi:hypothetical protein